MVLKNRSKILESTDDEPIYEDDDRPYSGLLEEE